MKNLLSLILECLDYERLIEEGKNPVEFLHNKYKDVPIVILSGFSAIRRMNMTLFLRT